jgi:hypothetical protein
MPAKDVRNITDAKALRALAHPLRMRLLHLISQQGALTATQCAKLVGESVANCSYHLNMLAKYDYIEQADGGQGREKPWRAVHEGHAWSDVSEDTETSLAAEAASGAFLDFAFTMIRDRFRVLSLEPEEWRDAIGADDSNGYLTAAELSAVRAEIRTIIKRYKDRVHDPATRPEGARPVHFFLASTVEPQTD